MRTSTGKRGPVFLAGVVGIAIGAESAALLEAQTPPAACVAGGAPFRAAIQEVHERQENVGYAAAVMLGGRLVESVVGGLADLEHGVPVKPTSRFGTASVTKAFTGAALLGLWERGLIDLDAPVHALVPEYPRAERGPITIRHLLTHTSGIPPSPGPTPVALRDALR